MIIYIPIWLDLLYDKDLWKRLENENLHSNMVRFIIIIFFSIHFIINQIYIPIWLDLLFFFKKVLDKIYFNLHSNMVRFIIFF